jgi:MFS family permease
MDKMKIGMIGGSLFLGKALMSLAVMKLSDYFGRKPISLCSFLGLIIFQIGLILSTNYHLTVGLMFGLGCCISSTTCVSYIYVCELLSPSQFYTYNLVWVVSDGVCNCIAILSYMYIDNDYLWIAIV